MSNLTLYKATELATLHNFIDEETGEIDMDGFESASIALVEKQRAVVAYLKNEDANIELLDGAIKELTARKKSMQSRHDNLKGYLLANMKAKGITEISAPDFTFTAKIKKNPPKLIIDDAGKIPSNLYIYPVAPPPTPDNAAIKAALLAGEDIQGAHIEQGERVEIKQSPKH